MKQSYTCANKRTSVGATLALLALLAAPAAHAQIISSTPKLEAEDPAVATLSGSAIVATTPVGFSGTGYVDYNGAPSGVVFKYTAATAGTYDLLVRYESKFGEKYGNLVVNGISQSQFYFNGTATGAAFRSTSPRRITLKAGENTITIEAGYNYYGIDFIQVAASAPTATPLVPSATGRVEAEDGQLVAVQAVLRDGETAPVSGKFYVMNFSDVKAAAGSITLPVTIATAGAYQITVGARQMYDGKTVEVEVFTNGASVGKVSQPLGATLLGDFRPIVIGKYNLSAGLNTIVITSQYGFTEVDYVDITATTIGLASKASLEAQKALAVYPNPANGQNLSVRLESAAARDASIELVNSLGQRVLSTSRRLQVGANQFALPTGRVAAGIYQLVVRSADQPVLSRRVVITE